MFFHLSQPASSAREPVFQEGNSVEKILVSFLREKPQGVLELTEWEGGGGGGGRRGGARSLERSGQDE